MTLPDKIRIVAIFGPTAVGKSAVALEVARATGGEIVSADSMQIYRGLPILTDQPPRNMLALAPHHMVGEVPLGQEYSAAVYARRAAAVVGEVSMRGHLPVVVGGTGLYVRALLGGLSFAPRSGAGVRRKWEIFIQQRGTAAALSELRTLDPQAAAAIDGANPRRLARALEAAEASKSGAPARPIERERLWLADSPYQVLSFGLEMPREELYARIDARVDEMLASGALEEVRLALEGEVSRTAAQAIGFPELAAHLDGSLSLEEAAAAIRQKTRRYAKRQLTWMRKMPDVARIDLALRTPGQAAQEIISRVRQAGFIS